MSIYKYLLIKFLFLFIFIGFLGSHVSSTAIKKQPDPLVREVHDLKSSLKTFQDQLAKIVKKLDKGKPLSPPPSQANLWILTYIEGLSQFLKKKAQDFFDGFGEISKVFTNPPPLQRPWSFHILGLVTSISLSFFSIGIGRFFIKKKLVFLGKKHRWNQMTYMTVILFLPCIFYFVLSVMTGVFLESFELATKSRWHLSYIASLPFHFYTVWAFLSWIRLSYSPSRPSQALIPMTPYGAHQSAFWMRLACILYFLATSFLSFIEIFPITNGMMDTFIDTAILLIIFSFLKSISFMRGYAIITSPREKMAERLVILKWTLAGIGGLWLVGRSLFIDWMVPILVTFLCLILRPSLHTCLRKGRLSLLRRKKSNQVFLRSFLISKNLPYYGSLYSIYFLLSSVWFFYLWNDNVALFLSISQWMVILLSSSFMTNIFNAFLIFLGAILLVKGGERILKYYVEDKYTTDSLENNFLASRLKTLLAVLKAGLRIFVWIPAISIILIQFGGMNLTTWITSIGFAGFGLTVGVQNIVRDFVTGFFIVFENNLMVGDEVDVDGKTGKVEAITIRTLKIRADNGMLLTIPFGSIIVIGNKNRIFSAVVMNISVGYREDLERVQSLIERAFTLLKRTPSVGRKIMGPLEIRGVNEVTSYSVIFQIKIRTAPNSQDFVRRAFNKQLKLLFDEANISVPLPPHTVHRADPSLTHTIL